MEQVNMSIGEVLKERRIELNIKQEDLAERMGVTVQTVSKWERGKTEPKASQVTLLAASLKLSEKEICQGVKKKTSQYDAFDFVKIISACIRDTSETDLILAIYENVEDPEGFVTALASKASSPFHTLKEQEKKQAQLIISLIQEGSIKPENEQEKEEILRKMNEIINQ